MKTLITSMLILLAVTVMAQDEIQIGNQTWMKYNLITEQGVWYGGTQANAAYGKLYTWEEAKDACPSGWHLPTKAEWRELDTFLGATYDAQGRTMTAGESGRKLQEIGFSHWFCPFANKVGISFHASTIAKFNGQDLYGFTALPAGMGYGNAYYNLGKYTYYWTATDEGNYAWYRGINYAVPWMTEVMAYKTGPNLARFSVRCVKD